MPERMPWFRRTPKPAPTEALQPSIEKTRERQKTSAEIHTDVSEVWGLMDRIETEEGLEFTGSVSQEFLKLLNGERRQREGRRQAGLQKVLSSKEVFMRGLEDPLSVQFTVAALSRLMNQKTLYESKPQYERALALRAFGG